MKRLMLLLLLIVLTPSLYCQENKPSLSDERSFSMIVLPDPQNYHKFEANQPVFELLTTWIATNLEALKIKGVLCVGDLVDQNEWLVPDKITGDQTGTEQWESLSRAFKRLDNRAPYFLCTGNHDYGYKSAENRLSQFPRYFTPERNSFLRKTLVAVCNNAFGLPTLENAAYQLESDSWGELLILSLEFAPRDEVLTWAKELAESEKYKNHRVIVLTHSYMDVEGALIQKENYGVTPANYGQAIWDKLIYPTANIAFVICGHSCNERGHEDNVSFRIEKNAHGREVPQMMFNAQTAGGGWNGNGGDGWLRIMEFMPDGTTVKVNTYSPLFGFSPTTLQHAWRRAEYDQFEIKIEK